MAVPTTPLASGKATTRKGRTPGTARRSANRTYNADVASSQHNAAVVIEIGSAYSRVGLAGESSPRHVIETPDMPLPSTGRHSSQIIANEKMWEEKLYPLMSQILTDLLLIKPRSRRVLIIEPFVSPTAFRTALCRVLLLWLNVPSVLFVSGGAVTVPYALGRTTAGSMIVDVGQWEARIVCVSGGRYLIDTFQAVSCGFKSFVRAFMTEYNLTSSTKIPSEEDCCVILQKCFNSTESVSKGSICSIAIPSMSQPINVDLQVVHGCIDAFFFDASNPESLLFAILSTILSCPVDLRVTMVKNLTVVGGGIIGIPSFEKKLLRSVGHIFGGDEIGGQLRGTASKFKSLGPAVKNGPLSVVYPLPFSPNLISWIGGSILGSLEMADERWVYRQAFMGQDARNKERKEATDKGVSGVYDFLSVSM